jgi:hypothetical protein
MPAGQQLGVLAMLGQQREGVAGGFGDLVVERGGDHAVTSAFSALRSLAAAFKAARTMLW